MPDRASVAMYEAVGEVAGGGLDGCSGDGFGQRPGWWRSTVPGAGMLLVTRGTTRRCFGKRSLQGMPLP